jgi:methyltransferase (TIGR00027 family)
MGEELSGVSRTAVWMAELRATEDELFHDPLARSFVSAAATPVSPATVPPGTKEFLAIRTRFYDDWVRDACAAGVRQVVLLAAGLDSRAFRLDWPDGVRLFELDLPELFGFKEPVLAAGPAVAGCERVVVPVDLRGDWPGALAAAGFDRSAATGWVAEGLLPYLSHEDADRLLTTISSLSAPRSGMAFDHLDDSADDRAAMRQTSDTVRRMGAPIQSTKDDPVASLAGLGWTARVARVPERGESYGRPLPTGTDLVASNAMMLVSAARAT